MPDAIGSRIRPDAMVGLGYPPEGEKDGPLGSFVSAFIFQGWRKASRTLSDPIFVS